MLRSMSVDCNTIAVVAPAVSHVPEVGSITSPITLSNDDLPDPFGPMIATDDPIGISKVRSPTA